MRTIACLLLVIAGLGAQEWAPNLVIPQRHVIHWHPVPVPTPRPLPTPAVEISAVTAGVRIVDRVVTTTVDVHLRNPARVQQEAEVLLPVPHGVAVTGLDFEGGGTEPSARLLPREEAVRIYREIVSRVRDPALMEFIDSACIRTSVFPVPAGGTQRVRLVYEQHLERDGQRFDYVLPRSMHVGAQVPWTISARLASSDPVASIYSPSHRIEKQVDATGATRITLAPGAEREPGSFRLSWVVGSDPVEASVVAYPDVARGGGWFLLLAGAPEAQADDRPKLPREVSIVFDRSGSMNGEKMDQARAAALQVIAGLDPGERFNLFCYNHGVERFAEAPVAKDAGTEAAARAWVAAMMPRGGTNIHDALHAALAQGATDGALPVVLFLTDGIATVGPTAESEIRAMAKGHNPHQRRIFTFGVGSDVNTHLLEKLADDSRASAAFVLPGEDIELAAAATFERLRGPVLRDLTLRAHGAGGEAHGRLLDVSPLAIGDLFAGEELLLVGRYTAGDPLQLVLQGTGVDGAYAAEVTLDPEAASTVHGYVPRLWASRRIAVLVDAIRELGMAGGVAPSDPRYRELVDEVVRLSTEFGILTEYTAFLAEEGSQLAAAAPAAAEAAADAVFRDRAFQQRSGAGSVAQSLNAAERKAAKTVNLGNRYVDEELAEADAAGAIQPQAASAFFRRGAIWIEGHALRAQRRAADRRVPFGSDAYFALAERLATDGRQGLLALEGEVQLELDGELVAVEAP